MKILDTLFRTLLVLLIVTPILGVMGIFPAPIRDMYGSDAAFAFIEAISASGYVMWTMAAVFAVAIFLTVTNRMAAAALLILPITVNIVGFHALLDTGLFSGGAVMGNVLALLNVYFLWQNRARYAALLDKSSR